MYAFTLPISDLGLLNLIKKNSSDSMGLVSAGLGIPVTVIVFSFSPAAKKNVPDPDK